MAGEVVVVEECPWRAERVRVGGWALRIWDASGMTFRACCEDVCVGCLCEWCCALMEHDELRKMMEEKRMILERLRRDEAKRKKQELELVWPVSRRVIKAPLLTDNTEEEKRSPPPEAQ